jgi:hypothetical protein
VSLKILAGLCKTGAGKGSSYELDAATKAQTKFILINQKETNQDVIFARKVAKTKWLE